MPIDSCYSDAMVCYLQSCECKEFLLFVLFVLWIAVGILKNIRTIKLEQLFSKYLILWTLHCGNSRALAVSERALNGTYLMSRICIKHSSILLSWLHPWSIRNLGNLDLKYFKKTIDDNILRLRVNRLTYYYCLKSFWLLTTHFLFPNPVFYAD